VSPFYKGIKFELNPSQGHKSVLQMLGGISDKCPGSVAIIFKEDIAVAPKSGERLLYDPETGSEGEDKDKLLESFGLRTWTARP